MNRVWYLAPALVCLLTAPAWAHFIWIATGPNAAGKSAVHVLFGEDAIQCEANLLDKVAQTKLWSHEAGQPPQEIKLAIETKGEHGTWTAPTAIPSRAFTATCEYGIISRGGKTFLLNYHAKHIDATDAASLKNFARMESLKLDVVPSLKGDEGELQVLFAGKPAAKAQVMIWTPDKFEQEQELTTDADGKVKFNAKQKGLWQIRARHQHDVAGTKDGKEYPYEMHYSTLVLKNGTNGAR